jgi:kynureninase
VFAFHVAQGLTPERLREISLRQVGLLAHEFAALDADQRCAASTTCRRSGGPASSRSGRRALPIWSVTLRQASVFADARGEILRLGRPPTSATTNSAQQLPT